MKEAIRQRAVALGFDACRFTSALPPDTAGHFHDWLAAGRHGEMHYMARTAAKRMDPRLLLEGARSLIVLAVSYHDQPATPTLQDTSASAPDVVPASFQSASDDPRERTGRVARYARFTDYHAVLGERLAQLAEFVLRLGGEGTRAHGYVDTAPLLERDWAQRAGLGFIGKHTNLISRSLGNWCFLAEILTTLELEPDPPAPNRCGTCARCLAACPTQAIVAPFQLDARRCISYLTIELKGPIPVELRSHMGNRVFGCDDCLEVCPWNRFARLGRLMQSHARADLAEPELVALLALDEAAFKAQFAGTSLWRSKRRGLLRNACVALGNVGDASTIPALETAARDPEPLIAEHARWALREVQRRVVVGGPGAQERGMPEPERGG